MDDDVVDVTSFSALDAVELQYMKVDDDVVDVTLSANDVTSFSALSLDLVAMKVAR